MFDRTFLPPADLEFVIITDTHYFRDPGDRPVEFASRRKQAARAGRALRLAAALQPAFVVHLGDLAQAVPEGAEFAQTLDDALAQLDRCDVRPHHVAGNQDIGDKPDPTMPTAWVTPEALAAYHRRFGRSWYSFAAAGRHCIVLNSQIMNSNLPEAAEQRAWLEADLAAHAHQRILLFTHLPLFLRDENEPHLGHYDNLGQPDRAWLLDLIRRHQIELVVVGHSHWSFFNRIGATRYFVAPSTSHTRPGFSEAFSSAPPPEQGRDDAAKLGFYLVRLLPDRPRLHLIRTNGETAPPDASDGDLLLTRTSADLPHSRLGVTLTHPLAPLADVPLAWPSTIRQPVRNDYPLLACVELGARHVRVPLGDFRDPAQRERLALLRDEGIALTVCWLCDNSPDDLATIVACRDLLDTVELQLPGALHPTPATLAIARHIQHDLGLAVSLATILPNQLVPGKQLRRTRVGYLPEELAALDHHLAAAGVHVDRVLCRREASGDPTAQIAPVDGPFQALGAIDWAFDPATGDESIQTERVAQALWAIAAMPEARLYIEPFLDLDRTMDVGLGLLDRQSNPRPAFHALRCLNTCLFHAATSPHRLPSPTPPGHRAPGLATPGWRFWLALPGAESQPPMVLAAESLGQLTTGQAAARWIDLQRGRSHPLPTALTVDRPLLIATVSENGD